MQVKNEQLPIAVHHHHPSNNEINTETDKQAAGLIRSQIRANRLQERFCAIIAINTQGII